MKKALEDEAFVKELAEMEEPQQLCDALEDVVGGRSVRPHSPYVDQKKVVHVTLTTW